MALNKHYVDLDLLQNALRQALIDPVSSDPGTPANGQIWYNSTSNVFKFRANGVTHILGRLDQITAPTASVDLNNQKIINLGTPTADADAATKAYVDNVAAGLDAKASVKVATTANITLSGTQTIDGVALTGGERVLVKNQTSPAENGIWIVAGGAWARSSDADSWNELISAFVWVEQGTAHADQGWVCTVDSGGTLGTTGVLWVQFNGGTAYTGGDGLTLTGSTFSVNVDGVTIEINTDTLRIKDLGVSTGKIADDAVTFAKMQNIAQDRILGRVSSGTGDVEALTGAQVGALIGYVAPYTSAFGDNAATTFTFTHNFGTRDVNTVVYTNAAPYDVVYPKIENDTVNAVKVTFNVAPTTNQFMVKITKN